MSILKLKDEHGNWVGVPTLKGDKGDTGAQGPKGDKGDTYTLTSDDKQDIAELVKPLVDPDILKAFPTDTASGAIATFNDGADDLPLKSLVVDINPVQDLHGQDSPYPAGGGKNLFNIRAAHPFNNNVTLTFGADDSLTCKNKNGYTVNPFDAIVLHVSTGTYTLSTAYLPDRNIAVYGSDDGTTWAWYANGLSSTVQNRTLTIDKAFIRLVVQVGANETLTIPPIQIELGSTATSYAPYENICPISGWTEVGVEQRGVNLLDDTQRAFSYNAVYFGGATGQFAGGYVTLPKGTFTYSVENIDGSVTNLYARDLDNNPIAGFPAYNVNKKTFTLDKETGIRFWVYKNSYTSINDVKSAQVELGSTATPYEPYTGRSITIDLGQTVYGGKLDVLSGELTVDAVIASITDAERLLTWGVNKYVQGWTGFYFYRNGSPNIDFSGIADATLTNLLPINLLAWGGRNIGVYSDRKSTNPNSWYDVATFKNDSLGIVDSDTSEQAVNKLKAFLAVTPMRIVYKLVNPITVQLSANQVNSLLGVNNIWADSGDTTAEYRADTKLYIQKKIAEAISALS